MTWADGDYGYKKEITIDHTKVAGDETDFPVLISVTDANLADTSNSGHVQNSNGYDIVFYNSTEDTPLSHEIESYTNTDGTLVFWVKINSLSSTSDTIFYIYYGKSGVTVDPSSTSTWDSNFKTVQHLKDVTTSTIEDSTSNNNDGAKKAANEPIETNGKMGKAQDFDGSDDYVNCGHDTSLDITDEGTFEVWVYIELDQNNPILYKDYIDDKINYDMLVNSQGYPSFYVYDGGWKVTFGDTTTVVPANEWHHLVFTYNKSLPDSNLKWYYDGNPTAHQNYNTSLPTNAGNVIFGKYGSNDFNGTIDEIRISGVARGANWNSTDHAATNSPSTFMSFGSEETPPAVRVPRPTVAVGNPLVF